jgi:hypothetical protein
MKKELIITAGIILLLLGCSYAPLPSGLVGKDDEVKPIETSSHFISDSAPIKREVIGNPLKYAAKRIGLDLDNFELPRAYEGMYRLACRFPIIDSVSNRPLYMKQWAEDTTELINTQHREDGLKTVLYALEVLRGTNNYPQTDLTYDKTSLLEMEKELTKSNFAEKYRQIVLKLYQNYLIACELATEGRKNLTQEDLKFFNDMPCYYLAPDGKKMPEVTGNVDSHFQFIEHSRRVAYEYIFLAAKILAEATSDYVQATRSFKIENFYTDITKSKEKFHLTTPFGPVIIGGTGDDTYSEDSPLQIDIAGNDTYTNNAGGSYWTKNNIALCIDHSGQDFYNTPQENYVQGFGFLGVGLLIDLSGNDKYYAKHFCQAAGIMGVGAIWDANGDDIYSGNAFCQGAGMFGLGILMDSSGEDLYDCATLGQGAATTLGLGILSDLDGDDRYQMAIDPSKDTLGQAGGFGQGGALCFRAYPWAKKLTAYGGVGILTDYQGNDRYRTNGWSSQGGSYIMSLGVLVDYYGNDHYSSSSGGSGSSIHITNAICIDKNGHDIYEGKWGAGSGGDRSPGIFIDYNGNDVYGTNETTHSYGAARKPFGFSLFIDYEGQDKYTCKQTDKGYGDESFGGVLPDPDAITWPYAICLDLSGNDDYQLKHRENNSERFSFGHGIHLDTEPMGVPKEAYIGSPKATSLGQPIGEWTGGDVIDKIQNPLEPYRDFPIPELTKSSFYNDIKLLQNPDVFIRFQAIGRLVNYGSCVIPSLVEAIRASSHRQFNRDVMECIHYYLTQKKITEKESLELVPLLKAEDEEVRILMAHNLGWWEFKNCEDALIETLEKDKAGQVRRFALAGLLNLKSRKSVPLVQKLALTDLAKRIP